jgi:hypothetical protein
MPAHGTDRPSVPLSAGWSGFWGHETLPLASDAPSRQPLVTQTGPRPWGSPRGAPFFFTKCHRPSFVQFGIAGTRGGVLATHDPEQDIHGRP